MIRLLLIEDDLVDQKALAYTAEDEGYHCAVADSLQTAYEHLAAQTFDLIVCDYMLGDGTAFQILEQYPHIPMVMVTGREDVEIAVKAIKAGAYDYLIKDQDYRYLTLLPLVVKNALELKQMREMAQEQHAFNEALQDIITALTSTLELDEVLNRILVNLGRVVPHDHSSVMLLDGETAHIVHGSGWSASHLKILKKISFSVNDIPSLCAMYQSRQFYCLDNVSRSDGWYKIPETNEMVKAYLGAPICCNDRVIGFLNISSIQPATFNLLHGKHLLAFANHAAIAIENARLYQQAQALAVLEERQRLARDLHDAVSQTLFSARITLETLLKFKQPEQVGNHLPDVLRMVKGAMGEMRTLLLELRPKALAEASLHTLLEQLADAASSRTEAKVQLQIHTALADLPEEVKIAFYRVTQEALSNAIKYANAQQLHIIAKGKITIEVRDDGVGFLPGHREGLGFKIMRERAEAINAELHIHSQPARGTQVIMIWNGE